MNEELRKRKRVIASVVIVVTSGLIPQLHADDVFSGVDGDVHTKGVSILRLTFPSQGEVWRCEVKTSLDGEKYRLAGFGSLGVPRQLSSVSDNNGTTTILVPIVGWYDTEISFFGDPGTHWFRWGVGFRDQDKPRTLPDQSDKDIEPIRLDQMVNVKPARREDMDFIGRLRDPDLIRAMFGQNFFERQTGIAVEYYADPQMRAVDMIAQLLLATQEDGAERIMRHGRPLTDVRDAAEMLLALAEEYPNSSYAPYAAYYAGCSYTSLGIDRADKSVKAQRVAGQPRDKAAEFAQLMELVGSSPDCKNADRAFALALLGADDYLKPRILCQQSSLRCLTGAFASGEALLVSAEQVAPGEGTIRKWTKERRKQVAWLRNELAKGKTLPTNDED